MSRRGAKAALVGAAALGAALVTACSDEGGGDAAPATTAVAPLCAHLADVSTAWDLQASGPELGDPDALRAAADEQEAAIVGAVDTALATGEVPEDVAADLAQVREAAVAYLDDAVAWANGEDPTAPTIAPGTSDLQRRIDAWALERCGAEVWP